jgi:hypothetical protein
METKRCLKCNLDKKIDCFSRNYHCDDCQLAYQREHYRKNKAKVSQRIRKREIENDKWFAGYKATLKCEKCPESHSATLDFHHRKDKEFNVSSMIHSGYSLKRIQDEIKKCIVLCSNCHRKLHYNEKDAPLA